MRLHQALLIVCMFVGIDKAFGAEFIADRTAHGQGPPSTVFMVGDIVSGDYDRFVAMLKSRGANTISVELRSGGGNVHEAIKIGRLVRELSIWVGAPNGTMQNIKDASCALDNSRVGRVVPCVCASACTLIWFAGVMRGDIEIHIHSVRYDGSMFASLSPPEAAKMYRETMRVIRAYFSDMDVDERYADIMDHTSSTELEKFHFGMIRR
jgi:hypothetical protein